MFQKISGRENNFMDKRGWGITIFRRNVFVSLFQNISTENTLVFQKNLLSKIFMNRREGNHGFVEIFVSQDRNEKLCKGTLLFSRKQKISGIEKNLWIRGGISRSSVEIFMSHSAEKFCKGILLFLGKFLVSKSFMDEKGGITFFRRKFLVSQCRKISWASLRCFRKFGVSKNFMHNRGYQNFPPKIFCLTVPKNFVKEPFSVSLISGIKKCWG